MPRVDRNLVALIAAGIGAVFFIGPGLWAFFDPQGFYDELATFEPYNEHFIHDIGAFQIGIGVALASAIWRRNDALLAALLGAAVGSIFHTIAHFIDHDLGGKDSDVVVFSVITVVLLAGAALRVQTTRP
jgi:peptidoglycan/LPS O-acetylase OafA/YrhL